MREMWEAGLPYQFMLVFFLVGAPPAFMYPIVLLFLKWNESRIGKSMMFKGAALALIFTQGLVSLYMYSESWYPWFVAGVTAWLAFAVWYQFTTVIHVVRQGEIESRMENRPRRHSGQQAGS